MRRSEIFDSFVKIAEEKGMLSKDYHDSKKKLEQTGRADSLDISAIEALYGVKPDAPKDMEYKKNIMEDAHPNSVVISPSYDKLNGLVENNNERQNILLHIVQKTPDGLLTQRKYAEKELLLSLVRIGNDLDNRNKDELRALSDVCLEQVHHKGFKKEALGPLAIVALVGAALGAIYAHQHLPNTDKGIQENYKTLMDELNDFLNSSVGVGLVGHEYDAELKQDVKGFRDRLGQFMSAYNANHEAVRQLEKPHDAKELAEIAQQPQTQTVIRAYRNLQALITNMATYMDQVERNFKSTAYKAQHTKDKGVLNWLTETTHITGGNTALFADDFQDVINAISPFRSSVADLLKMLEDAKSFEDKAKNDLVASISKSESEFGSGSNFQNVPYKAPDKGAPESIPVGNKGVNDIDKEADELSKMLNI